VLVFFSPQVFASCHNGIINGMKLKVWWWGTLQRRNVHTKLCKYLSSGSHAINLSLLKNEWWTKNIPCNLGLHLSCSKTCKHAMILKWTQHLFSPIYVFMLLLTWIQGRNKFTQRQCQPIILSKKQNRKQIDFTWGWNIYTAKSVRNCCFLHSLPIVHNIAFT
jgi:hypothetical protein